MARYTVNGSWDTQVAIALTPPIQTTPTAGFWGWSRVLGKPGTEPVRAPKPGVHSISPSVLNQPSNCAPDVIYPSLYQSVPDIAWRHVPVRPQEIMPVPAQNLFNMPGTAMRSRKVGTAYQIQQPSVVQTWPDLLGRFGPGWYGAGSPSKK